MKGAVEVGGARLAYEVLGTGPPVVLVHEGVCDSRMWEPQVGPLVEAGYRVVRYDLRGYGSSTLPPGPFSHLDDLPAVLDEVGVDAARFVGASLGGRIVLEHAVVRPESVHALVLVGGALRDWEWSDVIRRFGEEEEALLDRGEIDAAVELNVRTWVDGPEREPADVDRAVRVKVAEMQRRAFEVDLAAYAEEPHPGPEDPLEPPASTRLGEIASPTFVVTGEQDQPDILRIAERLAEEIPGSRRALIAGTAHVPNMEKPEEFNLLLLEFLAAS